MRVSRYTETDDAEIFAVGDVADLKGTPGGLWPMGAAHAATAVEAMPGVPVPYATPRIVRQLKCEGIDLRSHGDVIAKKSGETFYAREGDAAWWRLVVRHGQLAGGLNVGPPSSAKAFTKVLQQPLNLTLIRAELHAGNLDALKQLARG